MALADAARIPGRCAIRRRVTAVGWAHNSTGRRSRFARGCSRADDRSTRRWLTERVLCGLQSWRCAHGSSSPAVAGSNWRPVSSGSSRKQQRSVPPRAVAVPLPRREILEAQTSLFSIAACLRDERPVYARGMALLSRLLSDGHGPAYNRMPEARCAMRSERSPLRLTVNGVHDGRRELGGCSLRHRRARIPRRELRRIPRHRLRTSAWRLWTLGPDTGLARRDRA